MTKIRSVRKGTLDGGNGAEALRGDGKVVMMDSVPKLETGIWGVISRLKVSKNVLLWEFQQVSWGGIG